ncbi:hypothetical protein [Arthrobacter sp. VKM Ac-2550]|uniref:hypothetical protein n=1 Tax=Crystallibacter permensis TaxID=1938888 RepID=UPI0022262552|nr:hypothetical protein [Arthrobacter sp. VKM Ac-2550]MCW2133726.1 hypothetical protein [Arthrobacter sp. VKM Ac-2550]
MDDARYALAGGGRIELEGPVVGRWMSSVWDMTARKGRVGAEAVCAVDEDEAVAVAEALSLVPSGQTATDLGHSLGAELQAVSVGLGWQVLLGKRPPYRRQTFNGVAVLVSGKFDFDLYNTASSLKSELQVWRTPEVIVAKARLKGGELGPYICKVSRPAVLMVRNGDRRSIIVRPEMTKGPFLQVGYRNLDWTWAQATLPPHDTASPEVDRLRKLTACRGMALEDLLADGMPVDAAEQYLEILALPQGRGALHAMGALLAAPLAAAQLVEQPASAANLDPPRTIQLLSPRNAMGMRLYEQGEFNGLGPWLWEHPWRTLLIGIFGTAAGVWLTFFRHTLQGSVSQTSVVGLLGLIAAVGGVCCLGFWFLIRPGPEDKELSFRPEDDPAPKSFPAGQIATGSEQQD